MGLASIRRLYGMKSNKIDEQASLRFTAWRSSLGAQRSDRELEATQREKTNGSFLSHEEASGVTAKPSDHYYVWQPDNTQSSFVDGLKEFSPWLPRPVWTTADELLHSYVEDLISYHAIGARSVGRPGDRFYLVDFVRQVRITSEAICSMIYSPTSPKLFCSMPSGKHRILYDPS